MLPFSRILAAFFCGVFANGCSAPAPARQNEVEVAEHDVGGRTANEVFADARLRALAEAACAGRREEVSDLITSGIDPDSEGLDGVTPLIWAQSCESLPGMEALLRGGADPNKRFYRYNAVWLAASEYRVEQLQLLLRYGGDTSATSDDGKTILIAAIRRGDRGEGWDNFEFLLRSGAPIEQVTRAAWLVDRETTAAEDAASLNNFEQVVQLLERGYNVRLRILASIIEFKIQNDAPIPPEQVQWRDRAIEILVERGVQFPVGAVECEEEDDPLCPR